MHYKHTSMSLAVRSAVVHLCTTRGQYLSIISVSAALQESLEPPVVYLSPYTHSFIKLSLDV